MWYVQHLKNVWITSHVLKYKPYDSNFELSSKWILTKNQNLKEKKNVGLKVGGHWNQNSKPDCKER